MKLMLNKLYQCPNIYNKKMSPECTFSLFVFFFSFLATDQESWCWLQKGNKIFCHLIYKILSFVTMLLSLKL